MGKGDMRTRRGKVHRGTYGKSRPRPSKRSTGTKTTPKKTRKRR